MKIDPILVFTHELIGLGEDGPTHQPIEQLNMLRLIPNSNVFRPCDMIETIICWKAALKLMMHPLLYVYLVKIYLKYQKTQSHKLQGAYTIFETSKINLISIIATGSEVSLAIDVANLLKESKIQSKVSVPSTSIFERQNNFSKRNY